MPNANTAVATGKHNVNRSGLLTTISMTVSNVHNSSYLPNRLADSYLGFRRGDQIIR
jgi:hypothetical protein